MVVIAVWGTTFVATKMLLSHGLSPRDIFFFRFLLAYMGIWFFGPRRLFAQHIKDELLLILAGIFGGSLYYMAGNRALEITQASNLALLACSSPILTIFLSRLFSPFFPENGEPRNPHLLKGSLMALGGVVLVIFNGRFILQINPLGDALSLLAALSWALYIMVLKKLGPSYSMLFITRKVFFYGLLSLLPLFYFEPFNWNPQLLMQRAVWGNLLYLGLLASLVCYFLWNTVVKRLGPVRASAYVYLSPLVTMGASLIVLGETITPMALGGALLILLGVALAER